MECFNHLPQDPFQPGKSPSEDILAREAFAEEWEKLPFTQHFLGKLKVTREVLTKELVDGTRDKWGNDHSDAKRAVIYYADTLLTYLPRIKAEAAIVRKGQEMIAAKSDRFGGNIHGSDRITQR